MSRVQHSLFELCGALAVITILLLAGACSNPAENAPEAEVSEPVTSGAAVEGDVYEITPDSKVQFVGSKVTGSHEGGFNEFTGTITLVDGDPTRSKVELTIDTTSLYSDNERLTGHLKSPDFFDVEKFPTASFESTGIAAKDLGYTVTGNLELHGVAKSISFPAEITVGEGEVTANAEFAIQRFDFGIVYPGKADDLIRDDVLIRFDIVAKPAG